MWTAPPAFSSSSGASRAIVFIVGIFVFLTKEGLDFVLGPLKLGEFLTSIAWRPTSNNPTYGALALIVGTASVTGFAMLLSVPLSLGAALFIAEFARGKTRETLKVLVEMLAAIPSVVWGFVGMSIMNPLIIQTFEIPVGLNVLNAGLILGLMAAPIMTTIAEDALKAVPDTYREAAEALGATRWEVNRQGGDSGVPERAPGCCAPGGREGVRGDDGRADGLRPRDQPAHQRLRLGAGAHRDDRRRARRHGDGRGSLRLPLHPGYPPLRGHLRQSTSPRTSSSAESGRSKRPVHRTPPAFERRCIHAGPLRSALLLARIALLFPLRRALPARRLAALVARAALPTDR